MTGWSVAILMSLPKPHYCRSHLVMSCLHIGYTKVPRGEHLPRKSALLVIGELALFSIGSHLLEDDGKAKDSTQPKEYGLQCIYRIS